MLAIETIHLTKRYRGKGGFHNVNLRVEGGQVFGCLGPNGAGKSSLVKTLVGLLRPDAGEGRVLGEPLGSLAARRHIGYLPELFRYHHWLTGEQLLRLHGQLYGMPRTAISRRIPEVLEQIGMTGHEGKRVGSYSKGMQQRIGLGCALIHDPQLLFLDEPTSALDPVGRKEIRNLLLQLKRDGKTILLNSHLLTEVESVCDSLMVLNRGEVVVQGSWEELRLGDLKGVIQVLGWQDGHRQELIGWAVDRGYLSVSGEMEVEASAGGDGAVTLRVPLHHREQLGAWIARLVQMGLTVIEATTAQNDLESLFFQWLDEERESGEQSS